MSELQLYLADHPFLRGIDPAILNELAACAQHAEFSTGEYLFRAGEPATGCFLMSRGHVALEVYDLHGGPLRVQTVGEPSVLGWSWLVPPYRWCFDARALDRTEVAHLDGEALRELCERNPSFGYEWVKRFTAVFAQRLRAARFELLELSGGR